MSGVMGAAWPGRALPLPPAGRAGRRSGVGGAVEFPGLVGPRALARPALGPAFSEEPQPPPGVCTESSQPRPGGPVRDQGRGADGQY